MLRPYNRRKTCRTQHHDRIRIRYDRTYRRQRRDRAVVQRGRASHHDRLRGPALRHVAHEAPQLDFASVVPVEGLIKARSTGGGTSTNGGAPTVEALATRTVSYWLALAPD